MASAGNANERGEEPRYDLRGRNKDGHKKFDIARENQEMDDTAGDQNSSDDNQTFKVEPGSSRKDSESKLHLKDPSNRNIENQDKTQETLQGKFSGCEPDKEIMNHRQLNIRLRSLKKSSEKFFSTEDQSEPHMNEAEHESVVEESDTVLSPKWLLPLMLLILAIMLVVLYVVYLIIKSNETIPAAKVKSKPHFTTAIDNLSLKFTAQDANLWHVIKSLGNNYLDPQAEELYKRPLVVTFVAFDENKFVVHCIARHFAMALATQSHLEVNQSLVHEQGGKSLKVHLDKKIGSFLDQGGSKVVHVRILNSMSYNDSMIFYKYCDNDNTKHQDAIFIFSLTLSKERYSNAESTEEKIVFGELRKYFLNELWNDSPEEQVTALHVRLADTTLFVNDEQETDSIQRLCLS